MFPFPEPPIVPSSQHATSAMSLRYEDVAQDGRLVLDAMPHGLGDVVWLGLLRHHPITPAMQARGIIPILTRLVVEGLGGPVAVRHSLEASGGFQLAHAVGDDGAVDRLLLNLWIDVYGARGRTYGPPPPGAGERVHLGRVFAEHVFSRLFAPPGERKVLRFDVDGLPEVPPDRYVWRRPEDLLELPDGAEPLDEAPFADATPIVFSLGHTDSNQHVNSLVYPRVFEEAALRRLAAHGRDTKLLSRFAEVAYRKPCFAGDRMRVLLRTFALGDRYGAVAALVPDGELGSRPHCWARLSFER